MKSKASDATHLDLEAILAEIGQFGRYQVHMYLYLAVAVMVTAAYNCQYVFAAGKVGFRCKVPECELSPPKFEANGWGKFALPAIGSDCKRLATIGKECVPASFTNHTKRCTSWIYQNHFTIVPEFDLACQEWKRTLVGTVHNAGVFVALPITAILSDKFGRKFALVGTAVAPAIFGVVRAFCNDYILYLVLEFLEALVGAGTYSTAFILALEMVGRNRRVLGGNLLSSAYAVGQMLAALFSWIFPYWRTYTIVIFAPSFLFIIYWLFAEESVRWLLSNGRKKEAVRILLKAAAVNKVKLSPKAMAMLTIAPTRVTTIKAESKRALVSKKSEPSVYLQVLKSKSILFRLCVCSFWWVSVTMIYYGLSINSVSLAGNQYINFMLTSIVEIPGCFLSVITLDRFGRKSSIMTGFFVSGICLLVLPFMTNPKLVIAFNLMGKMMITMIFCSIYIYTIELFPTKARHRLMGICSMTGRIGSMCAPQTPLLAQYWTSLPYLVFGVVAATAGLLMLLTPETLHIRLPDTIEQAEQLNVTAARTRTKTDLIVTSKSKGPAPYIHE